MSRIKSPKVGWTHLIIYLALIASGLTSAIAGQELAAGAFALAVVQMFCTQCGSRAAPLIYLKMPGTIGGGGYNRRRDSGSRQIARDNERKDAA